MAGKSSKFGNWSSSPSTRYRASGKNREFYTAENAPGLNPYATGGTIVDGGDGYTYHIFVADGTFTVTSPPAIIDSVEYMIIGGGGSAGSAGGGGGGGGFVFGSVVVSNSPGAYPITIGAGGATTPGTTPVRNGSSSTAFGLTASGGGGGAQSPGPAQGGFSSASAGGGVASPTIPGTAGVGDNDSSIPRQGYPGGYGAAPLGTGGGGGAGGYPPNYSTGGVLAGPARIAPEFPSTVIRQGIPSPVLPSWEPLVGPAGYAAGGYGTGSPAPLITRTNPANSGYGGNGPPGSAGGSSGIVCVKYVKNSLSRATGGTIEPNTTPTHPGVWRHIFTSPGTFTITDPTLQWIDYLAIGGGGGGGGKPSPGPSGSGGGGGGFVSSIHPAPGIAYDPSESHAWNSGYSAFTGERFPVSALAYTISIGAGGAGGNSSATPASQGSPTTIGSPGVNQIIAYGGGGGAFILAAPPYTMQGGSGGSGGGSSKYSYPGSVYGGSATPLAPTGGTQGSPAAPTPFPAGSTNNGGGGAAGQGPGGTPGGAGWYSVICPPAYGTPGPVAGQRYFSGGGGGHPGGTPGGAGGGAGAPSFSTNGTANTGGGGGGGGPPGPPIPGAPSQFAGSGGSGIVIIQYQE